MDRQFELKIEVKVTPHPETVSPETFDKLMDGELVNFESWFIERQRHRGAASPAGLISAEKGAVKTYLLYLCTRDSE